MSFIANIVENFAEGLGAVFKTSTPAYCDIETADTEHALVSKRGSLVSGFRISGLRFAIGPDEFESTVETLTRALGGYLMKAGHTIDIFASRDPEMVRNRLAAAAQGSKKTCERIGLQVDDILNSNEREIGKYTAEESIYFALWSRPTLLVPRELNDGRKELLDTARKAPKVKKGYQDPFATISALRELHAAAARSIFEDLKGAGMVVEMLTAHEMLTVARMNIDPAITHEGWKPSLVGDPLPLAQTPGMLTKGMSDQIDISDIQYPGVARQLFPREPYRLNTKHVRIGDTAYAPVVVEIPPREVMPFSSLFEKLGSANVPWRCMFRIDGGGMKWIATKDMLSTVLAITSSSNQRVAAAISDLKAAEFAGITNIKFRMSFCTWAPANKPDLLLRRASRLAQMVSSWGQAEVREVTGDSMLGFVSTVPFLTEECAANYAIAPLQDVMRMIPVMRPASPWASGSLLFRTADGRVMPFQPGSSKQTTWNYIFFGRPGYGKSVQMLNLLLNCCMQPGLSRLPRIGVVDIGPSSSYFVEMVAKSLPSSLRHLAQAFKLKMSSEFAINPCDTPLGCRLPTPEHKAFIVAILSQLATPAEADTPYARISEMISKLVDDIFLTYSDLRPNSTPKRYAQGAVPEVDRILAESNYPLSRETVWWHVVDFLFQKGFTREATLAQRYAVPIVADFAALPKQVVDLYGQITTESGQSLTAAFTSLISSALGDFPNLSTQTRFDIGEVRIAAINLEEVVKSGSAAAKRQSRVMYILASYALTKDYRLDTDTVKIMEAPDYYKEYHFKRVRENKEDLKWIAYDEFHQTASSQAVRDAVMIDMREGRKYNIGVILSSQGAGDFPPEMREFATATFIVDAGSDKNTRALQDFFGFNETARGLLSAYVNGPMPQGVPLLANISVKGQEPFTQLLYSTLGVETRWALSTTREDVLVRDNVCAILGPTEGRVACALSYPGGAKDAIERLREGGNANPVETVASQIIQRYERKMAA